MAKSNVFLIKKNFMEFDFNGKTLEWRGLSQKDLDLVSTQMDKPTIEFVKEQLNNRLSGEGKEEFLKTCFESMTAIELLNQLDEMLQKTKEGK